MPIKVSATLLALLLLAVAVVGAVRLGEMLRTERDGWDIFSQVTVTSEPVLIDPPTLLAADDRDSLIKVVNESRQFGIPFAVHVVVDDGSGRSANEIAAERFADTPIETVDDADDGLLMVVLVTEPDHTGTRVGFATGTHFYPRGGITPERLQYIADVQMQALIAENQIGPAVVEGATWVEWTQLFEPTPNEPPSNLVTGLRKLLEPWGTLAFGGLAALVLGAAALTRILTWRGQPGGESLDGAGAVDMGAIARGRVDRAVLAGAVLDAVDRGVLVVDHGQHLRRGAVTGTDRDTVLLAAIGEIEADGGSATAAVLSRYLAEHRTLRHTIEDRLAASGALDRRAPVVTVWLRGIALAGVVLGLAGLAVAVLGESGPFLAGSMALAATSLVTLIWNEQRRWTTRHGRATLNDWTAAHPAPEYRERALFDAIVGMDTIDLRTSARSPLRPDAQALATALAR